MQHDCILESGNTLLRPLAEEDLEPLRLLRNRPENRQAFFDGRLIEAESQKNWYRSYLEKNGDYMFAVCDRSSGEMIGAVAIYGCSLQSSSAEFGRLLIDAEKAGGRGHGKTAAALACRFAREQLKIKNLRLSVFADNERAFALYRKIGFQESGRAEQEGREVIEMIHRPKKILYTASRLSHIMHFHRPYLQELIRRGGEIHLLGEGSEEIPEAERIFRLPMSKKILSLENLKMIRRIREILASEKYDLIVSNATLAGFLTRMAKKNLRKDRGRLIHISHGYLFSESTPSLKKGIYVLAELLCKRATDLLLVMNRQDLILARKYRLAEQIEPIPGMGIPKIDREGSAEESLRRECGWEESDFLTIYPAEYSGRKNHLFLIRQLADILRTHPQVRLLFAGEGESREALEEEIRRLGLEGQILLLGYQKRIRPLIAACDLAISSARSEGLPFNIMEAMSLGVPVIASKVKGHEDLIEDGKNGALFSLEDERELKTKFEELLQDGSLRERYRQASLETVQKYTLEAVFDSNMEKIEEQLLPSQRDSKKDR